MIHEPWQTVILTGGGLLALWVASVGVWVRKALMVLEEDTLREDPSSEIPNYEVVSWLRRLKEDKRALAVRLRFSRWLGFLAVPGSCAVLVGNAWGLLGFGAGWWVTAWVDAGRGFPPKRIKNCPAWTFRLWVRLTEPFSRLGRRRSPGEDVPGKMVFAEPLSRGLGQEEKKLLHKLLTGTAVLVSDIMTPWAGVKTTASLARRAKLLDTFRRSGHSRLPIARDGRVLGIIHVKDVLTAEDGESLEALMRPAYFVPRDAVIQEVLDSLRHTREHLAVAVDRLGRPAGVVTIEDILEEIVGELYDEREAPREADR